MRGGAGHLAFQVECRGFNPPVRSITFLASIRTGGRSSKRAGRSGAICHRSSPEVLTNDPGIDISAAPPEFSFGRASISNDPDVAEVSGSRRSFGSDQEF